MPFENAYPGRKDWRRTYCGARAVDRTCRNHGSCPYCLGNRMHATRQRNDAAEELLVEAPDGNNQWEAQSSVEQGASHGIDQPYESISPA